MLDAELIEAIRAERRRQRVKWGPQPHTPPWWYLILGEEFGELAKALLEGGDWREEAVHVAASAVAMLEEATWSTSDTRPDRDGKEERGG